MWILFLILMCGIAQADVYILTDSNNSVVGLSEQNDIVVPKGDSITVIKGTISNLPITGDPTMYNLNGNTFNLDKTKVQAQQDADKAVISKQIAKDNFKVSALGKIQDALTKTNPSDQLTNEEINAIMP